MSRTARVKHAYFIILSLTLLETAWLAPPAQAQLALPVQPPLDIVPPGVSGSVSGVVDLSNNPEQSSPSPSPSPSPAPASRRFENTDPSVGYGPGWTQDTSHAWSGGSAAVTTTAGARATFGFTGPSVVWLGGRSTQTGVANVYLDGTAVATVDTYSKTEEIRVPMFRLNGLSNSAHTLVIEASGQANAAASGDAIAIDAFDVPATVVSRLQETDPAVTYSTGWIQGDASRAWSAGAAALSSTAGAQASFAFTGTAISWLGTRGPQCGIADVYLDGSLVAEDDLYAASEEIQAQVFYAAGLADAAHTLTVIATGRANSAASSALVAIDGFEVTTPGRRYEETDPSVSYSAGWAQGNRDKAYSEGTVAESVSAGAQVSFSFTGTGVSWIGGRGPQTGIADVYLDGSFVTELDLYSVTEAPQKTVFTANGLSNAKHTLAVVVTGRRNPAAVNAWVVVDAFDVTP